MKAYLGVKPAKYEDGTSVNDVLKWNIYGTETIPPRPVLRIAVENTVKNNKKRILAYLRNIALAQNKGDLERLETVLLTSLGQQAAAEARRIINSGDQLQENAPSTVKAKGFDKPLYDEGTLAKNISYEVAE